MRKNKKSFTLSEVLISMTIIGFIMAMSIGTIKIVKASYTALTYFAFNNVQAMVGEAFSGSSSIEGGILSHVDESGNSVFIPYPVTKCATPGGLLISVFQADNEWGSYDQGVKNCGERSVNEGHTGKNIFCKALQGFSNTTGAVDCDNLRKVSFNGKEPYMVFEYENGKVKDTPNFIASNGQRYYISEWNFDSEYVSSIYGFRLISVDLNGKRHPNIDDNKYENSNKGSNPPDIVTFLVLDNGEVFPIGSAADNIRLPGGKKIQFLTSKVKGYYFSDTNHEEDSIPAECKKTYTLNAGLDKDQNKTENERYKGEEKTVRLCNFAVVNLKHETEYHEAPGQNSNQTMSLFTYREAYCTAYGNKGCAYKTYCEGITPSPLCPPSENEKVFDLCRVENIKPLFRYNFR